MRVLSVQKHPNADTLDVVVVLGYTCVVKSGTIQTNQLVAYIPTASIVPESILVNLGLVDRLGGSRKNIVRPIKLRGILSEGIIYPARPEWIEGQDVADELGLTKHVSVIPFSLSGEVNSGLPPIHFDIENIKKYPDTFRAGEQVIITEKLHGSLLLMTYHLLPENQREDMFLGTIQIISKGLARTGRYFTNLENNVYIQAAHAADLFVRIQTLAALIHPQSMITLIGEVLGVQDLHYSADRNEKAFRLFAIKINNQEYLHFDIMKKYAEMVGIETVPVLYRGPYSMKTVFEYTDGRETVTGKSLHMREGVVVYPVTERVAPNLGRVILKSVSEAYLLRKNLDRTEFN